VKDEQLSLAGRAIERGTSAPIRLATGVELHDGTGLFIEVHAIRGTRAGPVVYLGSGVHGDEAGAVAIVSSLIRDLSPTALSGTVLAVAVQNPLAFWSQHRLALSLLIRSPLDQGNTNVFQSYPGKPDGTATDRVAHFLFQTLMAQADVVIDLHTPTTGGRYLPFAFIPPSSLGVPSERARALVTAFGVRAVLGADGSTYTSGTTPHVAAARLGIAGFGVEMGEGGRVESDVVDAGTAGVRRVLAALGMIDSDPARHAPQPPPMDVGRLVPIRASRAGSLRPLVELGAMVAVDDVVAEIADLRGKVVERIVSPATGLAIRKATFPIVCTGDQVLQVAVAVS
jgi:predicted deacylase